MRGTHSTISKMHNRIYSMNIERQIINREKDCLQTEVSFPKLSYFRGSPPEVFFGKGVVQICSKFTGEHPYRSVISIKLQSNSIVITLRHEYSRVNVLHNFKTHFPKNTYGGLLLLFLYCLINKKISANVNVLGFSG